MLQRWKQVSRETPVGFYTLVGFAIFGGYGLIFRSAIDSAIEYPTGPWVDIFVTMIKIMLIIGPVVALIAIGLNWLFVFMLGAALTSINCLAYGGVFMIVFFPQGGGFVIGAFLGMGVGFAVFVVNVANRMRDNE
jgi:hypothetical protein